MVAPMLPGAEGLAEILAGMIDYAIIDRMNYNYADWVYRNYGLDDKMTDMEKFFSRKKFPGGKPLLDYAVGDMDGT
jgi:hypothetical protein